MLSFPNAKINLGLNIIEKRSDGYHNIETVFYPVVWKDVLEIIPSGKRINSKSEVQFRSSGIKISGSRQKNLCIKAYHLLKEKYPLPPVQMHLHKLIPIGAGLGGASSDAASTLILLNKIFILNISENELEKLTATLGADCSFFIRNKPVFASGKGDEFEEIGIDLSEYFIAVLKPSVHVSTATAYKNCEPKHPEVSIKEILKMPINEWKNFLVNDFEKTILKNHPEIKHAKEQLYDSGALYASMSGSGSAVFGIFSEEINLTEKFSGYTVWHKQKSAH